MKPLPTPLRTDSLSRQVFGILKEAVFDGRFKPSEPIAEIKVARWLNVSQATVREALVQLEQTGLVVRQKNRKTQVGQLSADDVRDRVAMRLALEPMAAVRAAQSMAACDFDEMNRILEEMERPCLQEGLSTANLAHLEFHRYIWEKSGSQILHRTLDQLATPLFAFIVATRTEPPMGHSVIVEAMRTGDPRSIEQRIREHIAQGYCEFLQPGGKMAARA